MFNCFIKRNSDASPKRSEEIISHWYDNADNDDQLIVCHLCPFLDNVNLAMVIHAIIVCLIMSRSLHDIVFCVGLPLRTWKLQLIIMQWADKQELPIGSI